MNFRKTVMLGIAVLAWTTMLLPAKDTHTLTSVDGKTIEAKIVSVTDSVASIHVGKRSMKVNMAKFSKETQAYLKEWQKNNISYSFAFERAGKMIKRAGGPGDVHHYGYDVSIDSRVSVPLKDLKIRYQIYNTVGEMKKGDYDVAHLGARGEIEFRTVAGSRTKYKRLYRWSGPYDRAGSIGNHLGGIWIRIYDKEDKMVAEWKNLVSKVKANKWSAGGKE